jgi:hypothetical protein
VKSSEAVDDGLAAADFGLTTSSQANPYRTSYPRLGRSVSVAPPPRDSSVPLDDRLNEDFVEALGDYDTFRQFGEAGEDGVFIVASTGIGWRVQASQLARALIRSAAHRVLTRGERGA